jgi:hypothetical protein
VLSAPPTPNQVASSTLADEVRKKVRECGLVLWLDVKRQYSDLVDALGTGAHEFKYAFRSRFREMA